MKLVVQGLQSGFVSLVAILVFVGAAAGIVVFTQKDRIFPRSSLEPTPGATETVQATLEATQEPTPSPFPLLPEAPTAIQSPKPTTTPVPAPVSNSPPGAGFAKQQVTTDMGTFTVSIISADLASTRVIVDTASSSDCANDCPTLPLAEYASRNNAFAGINGSYFCPASYPTCAGKTNSFDTLAMNKDKVYFNSGNNVYSTIPAVIFLGGDTRFVKQSLEWGRDTGIDSMIANYPLLTFNSALEYQGGSNDGKLTGKGGRSFVGSTGSTIYIGVVHSATVAEAAQVMQALGIHNSLNLDDGGSTALWYGGYKAAPDVASQTQFSL